MTGATVYGTLQDYRKRLQKTSRSRAFWRLMHSIDLAVSANPSMSRWSPWLRRIALVEMTERPISVRCVERIGQVLIGRFRPVTTGALQMQNSPFSVEKIVAEGLRSLASSQCGAVNAPVEAHCVAHHWHGASKRQRGSLLGYENALLIAEDILG